MPFPRRLLAENEELVLDLRPHWIGLVGPIAETALIVVAVIVVLVSTPNSWPSWVRWLTFLLGVALFLWHAARRIVAWATSHFVVTSDRLIHRSGWFAKQSMEIPLERISDVRFHQGAFERLIGAGDLTIESPGEYGQETFTDIRRPEHVQKVVYEMTEANQQRMATTSSRPASVADELAKLDRLRDDGVLTEEEFEAQKARLLGSR
jgi:uncharacterized membrane protein YdbT with pleckstrin-like domain